MTFAQYLKKEEGFISFKQYKAFLDQLPKEAQEKVRTYYELKYEDYEKFNQEMEQITLF